MLNNIHSIVVISIQTVFTINLLKHVLLIKNLTHTLQ